MYPVLFAIIIMVDVRCWGCSLLGCLLSEVPLYLLSVIPRLLMGGAGTY